MAYGRARSGPCDIRRMIAANSGWPGGECGVRGGVRSVHAGHTTQGEDIVANWIAAVAGRDWRAWDGHAKAALGQARGMAGVDSTSHAALQGVGYVAAAEPRCFEFSDAGPAAGRGW